VDSETYYLAILYFEMAYAQPQDTMYLFLARSLAMLSRYVERTGESDWEPVTDRLDEARSSMNDLDDAARTALLARVHSELDAVDVEATAVEAAQGPNVVDGMVFVPGGAFLSGTGNQSKELKAYWIDQYPVTNAQYLTFVEATGYRSPRFWPEGRLRDPDAPVVGISWYDAYKYAAFAGKSLPTKDQWEKAARGAGGNVYPWGNEMVAEAANFGGEDGTDGVAKVGLFPLNVSEFGASEMCGNVWEWTDSPDPTDSEQKVICGGSWVDDPSFLRCDEHLAGYPKDKYDNIGFRCVRLAN
jgi:formylglycine-generating enzyme required for sulfatase activity